jgi:hypothetical protein
MISNQRNFKEAIPLCENLEVYFDGFLTVHRSIDLN